MGRKLLLLFLLFSMTALSQDNEPKELFSQAIGKNIKKYTRLSQQAYMDEDFERAEFLFDSLINHVVNGSYLDNFKVRKLSGRKKELNDFDKPVFLMTYASWCTPGKGEIPALNEIAESHYKDIDFVVLFWDRKEKVKKVAGEYSRRITVLYVDEMENTHDHIVQTMKHSLGFPTSFFIDKDKRIVDVRRGALHHYNEEYAISFELNYNAFLNGISLLINLDELGDEGLVNKDNP
ncbi:TlpA family protein disulfide reductase [Constantimarinum furrinae]|uniref:Thiol-disulfide isomerase n=1 Tax=Constantimarinum furrinae TaxID=2562285 RepID=A0A7G8PW00_9FLAO|nr:TlpA disulfide reductase family protein [Constantimarinum furrinae]QNJ98516.1 Thiol-disulfide isomerase [Constantimarinum furrinae]